jgi:hypothetical protein
MSRTTTIKTAQKNNVILTFISSLAGVIVGVPISIALVTPIVHAEMANYGKETTTQVAPAQTNTASCTAPVETAPAAETSNAPTVKQSNSATTATFAYKPHGNVTDSYNTTYNQTNVNTTTTNNSVSIVKDSYNTIDSNNTKNINSNNTDIDVDVNINSNNKTINIDKSVNIDSHDKTWNSFNTETVKNDSDQDHTHDGKTNDDHHN